MRTRSNCHSHKHSTRRRLRLAFALALTAAPSLSLAVETLPRSLPAQLTSIQASPLQLDHPDHQAAGLLPYPFGPSPLNQTTTPSSKQHQKLDRLVALVGLHHHAVHQNPAMCHAPDATCEVAQAALNRASLPAMHLQAVPSRLVSEHPVAGPTVSAQVVPASGTQSVRRESANESAPALPSPMAMPALPAAQLSGASRGLPSLQPAAVSIESSVASSAESSVQSSLKPALKSPPQSASQELPSTRGQTPVAPITAQQAEDFDALSQSLIDIAIPMDMMQPALPAASSAAVTTAVAATLSSTPASAGRQPELIQPAKSLSLTTRPPSTQSVNLSLNDTSVEPQADLSESSRGATARSTPASAASNSAKPAQTYALSDTDAPEAQPSERGVALHLSSASQMPMKAQPVGAQPVQSQPVQSHQAQPTQAQSAQAQSFAVSPAKKTTSTRPDAAFDEVGRPQFPPTSGGMQVRIEGEPAPLVKSRMAEAMGTMATAAPLPSMERFARVAPSPRVEQHETQPKVKASFASRTSVVPEHPSESTGKLLGSPASQPHPTLTLGLQQSQTLTAQFVITELSVEHPGICQLMQTGESTVSLVGLRPGDTRIALVMVNDSGERQVEIHEVSVASAVRGSQSLSDMAAEMSRSVGRLVPNSDVEVVAYEDYLLVHGFTHYESDAKKILSLVRKTSLVPVVDQLKSNDQ